MPDVFLVPDRDLVVVGLFEVLLDLGLAVVLGLLVWVLTMLVDLPVIGEYFEEAQQYITNYADSTNYEDEFAEMNEQLHEINENIKKLDDQPQ